MSTHVLRCDGAPVPLALSALSSTQTDAIPDTAEIDELLPVLAAVLTHLMRTERLHVQIGYVPIDKTYGSHAYQTGTGNAAAKRAIEGRATEVPLIRDDTGKVLVGRARITGPGEEKLEGEAYVDDTQLFSGKVTSMLVSPTLHLPGVRATIRKRIRKRRWIDGRAAQLGTPGAVVCRDGITTERTVPRSSFYRHKEPWLLVR